MRGSLEELGYIFSATAATGAAACRTFYPIFIIETFGLEKLPSVHGYITLAKGFTAAVLGYVFGKNF